MSRFELDKSIEATKLDRRSGLAAENCTIPFGAIIEGLHEDGSWKKFSFLGDRYRCKHDVLEGALKSIGAAEEVSAGGPAIAAEPALEIRLRWEELQSNLKTRRTKVPGGWLVALTGASVSSVTFYPDPEHQWDGASLP